MDNKNETRVRTDDQCDLSAALPRYSPRLNQSCILRSLANRKNRDRIIRNMDEFVSDFLPSLFLGKDKGALVAAYLLLSKKQFDELLANPRIEDFTWTDLLRMFGISDCPDRPTPKDAAKLLLPRLMGANPDLLAQLVREFPKTFDFLTNK